MSTPIQSDYDIERDKEIKHLHRALEKACGWMAKEAEMLDVDEFMCPARSAADEAWEIKRNCFVICKPGIEADCWLQFFKEEDK